MNSQEQPKKCYCARCFMQIEPEDKVDIEGQNFHRLCSTCCICRTIPTSIKMFYGHVFCNECFKTHVLTKFRGESPRIHSNSWWMQWAPGTKPHEAKESTDDKDAEMKSHNDAESQPRKCICARCLQAVDENNKMDVGGQTFHPQCAKCYFCQTIPTENLKIYYGQVFCEQCFHRHVLSRNKDNPSEFFRTCFEQWQNNSQFSENMREFMTGRGEAAPFIFMMHGSQSPFYRCGSGPQDWFLPNEPRKSATPATVSVGDDSFDTWDLSFENRTEVSDFPETNTIIENSAYHEHLIVAAAEKIEKLTKYLHEKPVDNNHQKSTKKWKNYIECDKNSLTSDCDQSYNGWVNLADPKKYKTNLDCPKCLWQCGPIYVNSKYLRKDYCEENCSFE
ncbi:uncharacterized protein LOC113514450 [Galleria mellonella]|uniref:Uncharacterized protein LOC113514450 n=1 Tax=Galleria mellonella TaxID=7137 RepID=A0A6J3BRU2_GALME|nr:uncharacterized protein LOC113514450 [Galleria mellonella]